MVWNKVRNNITVSILVLTLAIWFLYAVLYFYLRDSHTTSIAASGVLTLIGEAGLDFIIFCLGISLWKKTAEQFEKNIYLIFAISFLFAAFADTVYNLILNVFHIQQFNIGLYLLFDIPFLLFLILQTSIWLFIFIKNIKYEPIKIYTYLPVIFIAILIFLTFMFGIQWRISKLSTVGFLQSIDTLLEAISFVFAVSCLARAKTTVLRFLSTGFLLVIASDLMIRYDFITNTISAENPFELTWVLGLLFITAGFLFAKYSQSDTDNTNLELLPNNSLQAQIALWSFILCLLLIFSIAATVFLFSLNKQIYLRERIISLPSVFIFFSVLSAICSNYVSMKLSAPIQNLENLIINFWNTQNEKEYQQILKNSYILEFSNLEKFFIESFKAYQQKHQLEVEFAKTATQVAHDIRSPLATLEIVTNSLQNIDEQPRNLINSAITSIKHTADNLLKQYKNKKQTKPEQIATLLEEVILQKKIEFSAKPISFEIYISRNIKPALVSLSAPEFKRVISNLINNAVEAIENHGKITVNMKKINHFALIEITDTGKGMSKEAIEKILATGESFEKPQGHGLGLTYAINCLKKWHGEFKIKSKIGKGTTILLFLPIT